MGSTWNPEFYQAHKERWVEYRKRSLVKNHEAIQKCKRNFSREYSGKIRNALFDILGSNKCVICGFSDIRALQFDHINGGGTRERKQFKHNRSTALQYYVKHPDEARVKLQVLCANCNWIKRVE